MNDTSRAEQRVEQMRKVSQGFIRQTNRNISSQQHSSDLQYDTRAKPDMNIRTQTRFEKVSPQQAEQYNKNTFSKMPQQKKKQGFNPHRNCNTTIHKPEEPDISAEQEKDLSSGNTSDILGDLFFRDSKIDKDKLIIIILIIILARQKADLKLLLALGYILL